MPPDPLIHLDGIKKVFFTDEVETHALADIHLTIARGEYVSMAGPSGCGKSTLLSILGLLDTPTDGTYTLNGQPVANLDFAARARIRNKEIGFIFQSFNLIGDLTVFENVELPLTYRGMATADRKEAAAMPAELQYLGTPDDLASILHTHTIDEVVFAVPTRQIADCTDMLALCEQEGVRAVILSNWFSSLVAHVSTDIQYDQPVLIYTSLRHKEWQILVKRLFDIGFSAGLLLVLGPMLLLIAFLIKIHDRGPIFYRWKVVGFNKEKFTGYKFRTMVVDADRLKAQLEAQNEMKGAVFKIRNDPRITPIGRLLRKFSLDELPQLWSVLKGDMSIVGPRPPLETELPRFDSWHRRKLSVKPGLTCLWQISGRSNITDFDEWVKLDLAYIDNWTLWLDFKILMKTIPAVLLGRGAH